MKFKTSTKRAAALAIQQAPPRLWAKVIDACLVTSLKNFGTCIVFSAYFRYNIGKGKTKENQKRISRGRGKQ